MEIYDSFLQARAASETVNVDALYVDGVEMPSPALSGIEISYEKIWSNDTGRVAAPPCNMVGTILAIKRTLTIKWPVLTRAEAAKIHAAVSGTTAFHELRFVDMCGNDTTLSVYFGTPKFGIYSYVPAMAYVENVSVTAIEK